MASVGLSHAAPALTGQDVGVPSLAGSMTTAAGKTTIIGGGADIWGTADNFYYAYFKVTGDFDYVVQVEDLQGPDGWTKAELMARIDDGSGMPQGGDPHISNMTTRSAGQNELGPQWRVTRDAASDRWAISPAVRPVYPNVWLRLERIGNVFYQYYSTDGKVWNQYTMASGAVANINTAGSSPPGGDSATSFTEAWPSAVLLGLAVTAHNDADPTGGIAVFSNFGAYTSVPIAITTQPVATVAANENKPLVLSVTATGDPVHYQWRKGGVDIAGATSATLTIPLAKISDSGTYSVRLFASGKEVISSNSVVSITQDKEAPKLASVSGDVSFTQVVVTYSEPVTATAENRANYALDKGITVTSVTRIDPFKVSLVISKMAEGTDYTLTVNNVQDTAIPANMIVANSKMTFKSFVFANGVVLHKFWDNFAANSIAGLLADARFPNAPTMATIEPMWEYGPNGSNESGSNYGNQLIGWFTPATSGNYVFFTNSDDPSNLFLSTDDTPANKKLIAQETGWSNQRNWVAVGSGDITTKRSDQFGGTEWPDGNTITLQAGRRYYIESLHTEGGGGDSVAVTFIKEGDADPVNGDAPKLTGSLIGTFLDPNGASVKFTQQPQNATAGENRDATFSVVAAGTSAYGTTVTYQWQTAPKASTAFTTIAGATSANYVTPLLTLADDGKQYRVVATVPTLSATSTVASVTISSDKIPPTVVSAGAIKGTSKVGVAFNELMEKVSSETVSNYTVAGATVTSAALSGGKYVVLSLSSAINAAPSVTVQNAKDLAGNPLAQTTVSGQLSDLVTSEDIGDIGVDPVVPGYATAFSSSAYLVAGGGHDIWDAADGFHFVYKEFTGPVDAKVRVEWMNPRSGLSHSSTWAKTELMVRESTAAGSRHVSICTTRTDGENAIEGQWRDTADAASGNLRFTTPIPYPNAWLRIVREDATKNIFKQYWSPDGVKWNLGATHTVPGEVLPAKVLVGIAQTSHDNDPTEPLSLGIVQELSIRTFTAVVDPQLRAALQSGKVVISWASGTLVGSSAVSGPYTPVAGAASPFSVTPQGSGMFYKVQQ